MYVCCEHCLTTCLWAMPRHTLFSSPSLLFYHLQGEGVIEFAENFFCLIHTSEWFKELSHSAENSQRASLLWSSPEKREGGPQPKA